MPKITQDPSWWKRNNRLYKIYHGIKSRCQNFTHASSKYYAEKGIKCGWDSFEDFEKDMKESYNLHVSKFNEKQTSIDRIDNSRNYCKENCRWATRSEQNLNKKPRNPFIYKGESKSMKEWSRIKGINYQTLVSRIKKHKWSEEKVFNKV